MRGAWSRSAGTSPVSEGVGYRRRFHGQIFAQLLQAYGVHQVDLAGIFDEKLQRNKEQFGVTETYNTTREQIPEDSYDVIIEAVGLPATQAQAVAAAKKGAQVLMFGVGPQEAISK